MAAEIPSEHYSQERVQNWVDKDLAENDHTDIPLHQPGYDEIILYPEYLELTEEEILRQQVEIPETPPPSPPRAATRPVEESMIPLIYTKKGVVLCNGQRIETEAKIPRVIHLRTTTSADPPEDDCGTNRTILHTRPSSSSSASSTVLEEEIQEVTDVVMEPPKKKPKKQASNETRSLLVAVRDLQKQERDWRQRWQWDEHDDRLRLQRAKRDREEYLVLDRKQADRRVAELTGDVARMNKRRFLKLGNSLEQPIVIP